MTQVVILLAIRDLTPEDLPSCAWSGSVRHLASVARALERARRGGAARLPRLRPPSASWDEEAPDGSLTRYETVCTLMRKELP